MFKAVSWQLCIAIWVIFGNNLLSATTRVRSVLIDVNCSVMYVVNHCYIVMHCVECVLTG